MWLGQIITAQAPARNTTKAKLWKQICCTEQAQNTAWEVQWALGSTTNKSGPTQVDAPDTCTPTKQYC